MFTNIFLLELRKNLTSPAYYIFFTIFFTTTLIFTLTTDPGTQFMGIGHGQEWHNAPIIIAHIMARLGVLGLLFTMVIVGRSVAKDFESNIHELVFSKPISKMQYLGGRFCGSLLANLLIFISIILAFEAGIYFMDPKYSGPFQFGTYLLPVILIVIPNLLFMGAILFALATLTRRMTATYLAGVAFLAVYSIIGVMLHRMDNETLKVLLDPFGITALTVYSRYWTVADMNTYLMPLNATLLLNRLMWLSVSIGILVYTYRKFKFIAFLELKSKKRDVIAENTEIRDYELPVPRISFRRTKFYSFAQSLSVSWKDFKRIVVHPAFLILTVLAISQIITNFMGQLGNDSGYMYPFTSWYIRQTVHIWMYMLPMTIFFGGMLIWKEKEFKTDEIINTMPIPNWFSYVNKLITLCGIYVLYLTLTLISGVATQILFYDFYDIELGLYIKQLFGIDFFNYLHLAIAVLFIQNLSPNKYIGFFWSALYFAADIMIFDVFGFENYLFRYGRVPDFIYSNLNGFGHFAQSIVWYTLLWLFLGAIIAWLTVLLWRRTNENSILVRVKYMLSNITKNQVSGLSILMVLFLISGLFIAYNKYALNPYYSEHDMNEMQANYEKKFAQYAHIPQPVILDIEMKADLFPSDRTVNIQGGYTLFNNTNESIVKFYINLNDWNLTNTMPISLNCGFTKSLHAEEFGFRILELEKVMLPGDTIEMTFKYDIIARGFSDNQPKNEIAQNGTYLILSSFSSEYFPVIGYNVNNELLSDRTRAEFTLDDKPDAPKIADADPRQAVLKLSRPNYNAVISTSVKQVAITAGHLMKQWQEGGRNYYHYQSDTIIQNEIAIISGRYEVTREMHDGVNVEVYYHPKHDYNIRSILDGLKDSHDYGCKYFSRYPYRDLRVVEIPDYMTYGAARHFPTTFIWVESEGFITRYEEGDIDIVYGIAAHENIHHWWAGQVTPAFAQGAFMLTESITQYVMAMLTEQKFGKEIGRKYLQRDMKSYLARRKRDAEGERPLIKCSIRQAYIGYKKSTAVMYALQDYIGEDSVGKALGRVVDQYGCRLDTFAMASDMLKEFYKVTPDSLKYFVDDLFLKITLYENKINSAIVEDIGNGKFMVGLDIETIKYYADSIGNQTKASMHDYIYVGLMDEDGRAFYYEKHRFSKNETTVQIIVEQKPFKAGIDPYLVLIDRDMDDNVCNVEDASKSIYSYLIESTGFLVAAR